jgi:hypothetical protein
VIWSGIGASLAEWVTKIKLRNIYNSGEFFNSEESKWSERASGRVHDEKYAHRVRSVDREVTVFDFCD